MPKQHRTGSALALVALAALSSSGCEEDGGYEYEPFVPPPAADAQSFDGNLAGDAAYGAADAAWLAGLDGAALDAAFVTDAWTLDAASGLDAGNVEDGGIGDASAVVDASAWSDASRPLDAGNQADAALRDAGPVVDAARPVDAAIDASTTSRDSGTVRSDAGDIVPPLPPDTAPRDWKLNSDSASQCPATPPVIPIVGGPCLGVYFMCGWTHPDGRKYSCTCDWVHWLCI